MRVAVDGVDGAGKTVFADDLAAASRAAGRDVVRICADDFLNPRDVRYRRGRDSAQGFWLDSYDYVRLRADVLEPLAPGGSRRYRRHAYDLTPDPSLWPPHQVAPPGAVLLLDGLFLHRDELAAAWDFSIFLDVAFSVSVARMAERDGTTSDPAPPSVARYLGGQRLYLAACHPQRRASVVVDNSDYDHPQIVGD